MNIAAPMVASMSSLFTPAVLFCVLNLMIGVIFFTSRLKLHKKQEHHPQYSGQDTVNSPDHHAPLVRVPSLLDRVKSFNFSSHRSEQPNPFYPTTQVHSINPHHEQDQNVEEMDHAMITRSKSETTTHANRAPEGRMKKSASEKAVVVKEQQQEEEEVERQRPATVRERKGRSFAEDEAVDEKADDFINRFRQQLKLQRLDSLLRYKEMLNRGVRG